MKTSYFAKKPPGIIGIATSVPDWMPDIPTLKALAPDYSWVRAAKDGTMSKDEYEVRYMAKLSKMNAMRVIEMAEALIDDVEPVLCCWCSAKTPGDWCHRHMAARWIETETGIAVPEWAPPGPGGASQGHLFSGF